MNFRITGIAILAASALAAAQQGPPPPGSDQRGPGPEGQRGQFGSPMRRMGPPMGVGLLMRPEVQQELKLTKDQIDKIEDLAPRPPMMGPGGPGSAGPGRQGQRPRAQGQPGGPPPGQGQLGGPPQGQGGFGAGRRGMDGQRMERMDRELRKILDESQYKRYKEISLQVQGAPALGRPDVAAKVGLSDDQVDQIHDLLEANRPQRIGPGRPNGGKGFGGPQPPRGEGGLDRTPPPLQGEAGRDGPGKQDFEKMREEMKAKRAEMEKKILAILTSSQKKTWEGMLGKPFKLEEPRRDR